MSGLLAGCVILVVFVPTPAGAATYQASMMFTAETEGSYAIRPGDWIAGGLIFRLPGRHSATHVTVEGHISYPIFCDPDLTRQVATSSVPIFTVTADVPQDDPRVIPTSTSADPAAFQRAFQWMRFPECEVVFTGRVADFHLSVVTDQRTPVEVAAHYRNPRGKGFANINCADPGSNPYPVDPAPCDAQFTPFQILTPDVGSTTPVPVGAVGGLGLTALLAMGLYGRGLRHRSRPPGR